MPAQRTPIADTTPLGIVKSIDAQRARYPSCTVALMPMQADAVRRLLMREHETTVARETEEARARAVAAAMGRPDPLAKEGA